MGKLQRAHLKEPSTLLFNNIHVSDTAIIYSNISLSRQISISLFTIILHDLDNLNEVENNSLYITYLFIKILFEIKNFF